ncbi:NAD-dependent epimerase/dehydratase family protein [Streptomyces armeniacus]|uniref:NAD-dependent epimerase/dehydratase family protein n=1 Tax=Streptomyces armeniacus TaxID=83291 RepID=A0A345XMG4_9ACTN|nr:NAD(P)H-binding protein [Streptomyces armeniacus]AXK32830.1 NAD-dependent epimerase/dehydratase family protein [Streptomyces armeniacus]
MTILVTGATGTVGHEVARQLAAAGHRVRALTRDPARAEAEGRLPEGVAAVAGDLTRPETVLGALEGATGLHLINFGGDDYAPLDGAGAELVRLAEKAGVRRVTMLLGGEKGPVEQAVEASGMAWTHLQPVEFMANALDWAESVRAEGEVRAAFAHTRSAMVHEADIAAVAVAALTEDGHGGRTYTLTGPEALTRPEKVRVLAEAVGRDIRYVELTEEQARAAWAAEGHSPETIEFFVWVHGNTPEIGYTVVPTVEEVTGRPARTFAQWAAEHADAFRGPAAGA